MDAEIFKLLPKLEEYTRAVPDPQPTAMEALTGLGKKLGIKLYAKRDDVSSIAMGGNKVRQLAYYLGPAVQQNADTVLITGAVQSNFVRLCAAFAARFGWHAVVQLEHRVADTDESYNHSGNVLLNQLLGAEVRFFPEGENEKAADAQLDAIAAEMSNKGRRPFVIHLGSEHPPLGGLGYAYCAVECFLQCRSQGIAPDHVIVPSGSGLTHAGFAAGASAIGWLVPVHGICVRRNARLQSTRIAQRIGELKALLGDHSPTSNDDINLHDSVLAPGYGRLNDEVMQAILLSARSEALVLDPVYSGRTMAGMIDLLSHGIIKPGQTVLFIHTGGLPALFAYQPQITAWLRNRHEAESCDQH
jgi:D-cysteine desulfhydrase/L-cysteate sulfo-lyase